MLARKRVLTLIVSAFYVYLTIPSPTLDKWFNEFDDKKFIEFYWELFHFLFSPIRKSVYNILTVNIRCWPKLDDKFIRFIWQVLNLHLTFIWNNSSFIAKFMSRLQRLWLFKMNLFHTSEIRENLLNFRHWLCFVLSSSERIAAHGYKKNHRYYIGKFLGW